MVRSRWCGVGVGVQIMMKTPRAITMCGFHFLTSKIFSLDLDGRRTDVPCPHQAGQYSQKERKRAHCTIPPASQAMLSIWLTANVCRRGLWVDNNKMVVRLRLQRFGRKHSPFYRMVAADARAPRDGKFLEIVSSWCLMLVTTSCLLDMLCCDVVNV